MCGSIGPIVSKNNRVRPRVNPHVPGEFYENRFFKTGACIVHSYTYTGCCILSSAIAISHTVRQGDAPVYYLHDILLIWNILTRTTEVTSVNKLGEMCDVV